MIRRLLSFILICVFITSCGNTGKKEVSSKNLTEESAIKVEFSALIKNPESYVGKNIILDGKVVHVCTETGKKMFIVGDNPDVRLYVAAGENISKFPMELLGSEITVVGVIKKVGGMAIAANEQPGKSKESMHASGDGMKKMASDSCETETALAEQPSLSNIIMEYKSHTLK